MSSTLWDIVLDWLVEHGWEVTGHRESDAGGMIEIAPSDGPAPWPVFVGVNGDAGRCAVYSVLPEVDLGRRDAVAVAMTRANNGLVAGRFDLDVEDGDARFVTAAELGGADPLPDTEVIGRILARLIAANLDAVAVYGEALSEVAAGADPHETIRAAEAG